MATSRGFYGEDLACIHETGFSRLIDSHSKSLLGIFQQAGIEGGRILNLGCGSGLWCQRLVAAGYEAFGVDISSAMIDRARQQVAGVEFQVGSIWNVEIPRCRAVTALGEVVNYLPTATTRPNFKAFFRRVFASLEPGGLLIFDLAEIGLDRDRKPTGFEGPDWACLTRYEYDSRRDRLTRHVTAFRQTGELFRRTQERHVVQLYDAQHVATQLREAGFRVRSVRKFGDSALLPGRVGFVARKP